MWEQYLLHHTPVQALNAVATYPVTLEPYSWQINPVPWNRESQITFGSSDDSVYLSSVAVKDGKLQYRVKNLTPSPAVFSLADDAQPFFLGGYERRESRKYNVSEGSEFCQNFMPCNSGKVVQLPAGTP